MSEGLKQSYFRKNLTGLQTINADTITAANINIPNGLLNTSTITCNYMNVCLIDYKDGGICTNLSANTALINQNASIVPFMNQSLTNLSYGAVSVSLCNFVNTSLINLSYGAVSTSLCTYVNSSLINLSYGAVSTSLCTYVNSSLTNLSYGAVSTSLVNYIKNLSYGAVSTSLVSFINTSLTNLSYGAVSTSLVSFINTSLTNLSYGAVSTSLVSFVNASIVNYVAGRNLTDIPTTNLYNSSMVIFVGGHNISLSGYTVAQCNLYNTSMITYVNGYNISLCNFINTSLTSLSYGAVSTSLVTYIQNLSYGAVSTSLCTFINSSLISLSYGAVSTSLCTFVNSSLTSLSYGAVSTSLVTYIQNLSYGAVSTSLVTYIKNLSYGAVSSSLCTFVNSSLTSLSYGAVSTSLVTYIQNLSYGAVSSSLVTYIQNLSYGAVSTSLCTFVNSSLTSLSYGAVSTSLVTYIQNLSYGAVSSSLVTYIQNLSYGAVSTSLCTFVNSSLTSLSYGAVSTSLVTYIQNLSYGAVSSSLVTYIQNLSYGAVSTSLCTFVNSSLTSLSYGDVSTSLCTFVNSSLTSLSYGDVSTSLCTFVNSSLTSLSYGAVSSSLTTFINTSLTSLSYGAVSTSLTTFINSSITSYNTSVTTAFTNLQNLSSVNASFKIVNISNLSCKSASFQYINISNLSCINASLNYVNISNLSCISGSFNTISISTLKCDYLYNYINTSIINTANNYNTSLVLYNNVSLGNVITKYKLGYLTNVTSDVQTQLNNCVQANLSLAQTIKSDCAITGVVSAIGGAVLGTAGAGLMISSMGVLSMANGAPLHIDGEMNCSYTANISYVNASHLYTSTMTCTDYSYFGGWENQIINISNTDLTSDSGSYTRLYGSILRYDTLVPSDGYVRNNVYNNNTTSTNINCTDFTSSRISYHVDSNISLLSVSSVSCVNLSSINISCMNLSALNANISFLNVSSVSCTGMSICNLSGVNSSLLGSTYIFNGKATWLTCSFVTDTLYAAITSINVSNLTFTSLINSGINQNLDMCCNQLNVSTNTNVCFVINPTAQGDMLICNNSNDTGFRIRRYYGGLPTSNVTTIQNSDRSPLYFTQPIGINIAPTTDMDLEVLGNVSSIGVFCRNLSAVNASFDTIWARNMIVDPATLWECSISLTGIIEENVCYSTVYNLSCIKINVSNLSCTTLYNNIDTSLKSLSYGGVSTSLVSFINSSLTSLSYGAVSASLVTYVKNLSYGAASASLVSFINSSITSLSYSTVSVSLVSFINSSLTSLSYGAVSASLVTYVKNLSYGAVSSSLVSFINSSITSLSYSTVSASLVSFINSSITSLSYSTVSASLVSFINSSLTSLSYGAVSASLVSYIKSLSYGDVSASLVSFINSSLTSLSYSLVSASLVSFINSSLTSLSYGSVSASLVTFVGSYNTSITSYINTQDSNYNTSLITFINDSIVNAQTNFTSVTNLSSVNSSFAFVNISTLATRNGNIINVCSTNSSFQNISTSYLILDNSTVNSGMILQSKTSTNMLRIIPYTGGGSYNPTTQTGDMLLVIGNVSGIADSGKVLNIVPHSSTACGLRMAGVNNTFSGSLTVTNNVSCASITTTNITCTNLTSFINTSIISQNNNYNSSLVSFINTSIVNANSNFNNVTGRIIFNNNALGTTYTGAKIVLWPGGTLSTSTDWYGFGMNGNTLVHNVPLGMRHSFQINGTESVYINSTGLTTTGTGNITSINCSTINIIDSTGNAMVLGTGSNAWLFNTYPFASLNGCFLGIRSNAIGGSWSSTLYSFDCFGSLTLTSDLKCNNTRSNNVYLNDVATTTNNPMQLFGYNNNIFLATSNSTSTGSIYFRNQTISPFAYNDFAIFSQAASIINSSLTLNNALTCTNINPSGNISFPNNGVGLKWGNNYSQIYDDMNLHISTDDTLYISAPTLCSITTPNCSLSGSLTCTTMVCNAVKVNSTQQAPSGNYIGHYFKYQITLASQVTTSWTNINSLNLFFSYTGAYIVSATFTIDFFPSFTTQTLFYALSTSSTDIDANTMKHMYYVTTSAANGIKQTLTIQRPIYISSTSTSVYLIAYSTLSSPIFYISNETPCSISSIRIG